MKASVICIIAYYMLLCSCHWSHTHGLQEKEWVVPVLLPIRDPCLQAAFTFGFNDIRNERIVGEDFIYKLEPSYHHVTSDLAELIDTTNRIHKHVLQKINPINNDFYAGIKKETDRLNKLTKKLTIGPPYSEQTIVYGEFAFSLPTLQVAYVEIPEPYDRSLQSRIQTPPSIAGVIKTGRRFIEKMDWKQVIIVFDFSNARYRLSVNKLEEHLLTPDANNKTIKVAYKARIRTEVDDIRTTDLLGLPNFNTRIVFLLVGVAGARQSFCQAYHMKLHISNYVWILFEELPEEWASDDYNIFDPRTGKRVREIDCTPEQLLLVSQRYVYLLRGGYRRDNKTTVNNGTAEQFVKRLQTAVGPDIKCSDSAGYAYDSVWTSLKLLQRVILLRTPRQQIFERDFSYIFGIVFRNPLERGPMYDVNFEGVTGHVSFKQDDLFRRKSRQSPNSIFSKQKGKDSIWVGSYNTGDDHFYLTDNAVQTLFGSGVIPSDNANVYKEYQFPKAYIITIWTLACLGILITVLLSCIVAIYSPLREQVRTVLHWVDVIICFGCVVCFASLIVYGLDTRLLTRDEYGDACSVFTSMLCIGFTLTFGALFTKTWWKYKCFNAPVVQDKREFSEWFMLVLISTLLAIDIVVLVSWGVASPITYTVTNPTNTTTNAHNEIFQIVQCDGKYHNQFLIGMYCYKGVLLVFGLFLAWQTTSKTNKGTNRISPSPAFKGDHMSIFNTVLVSIVGVVCITLLQDTEHRHALYAILSLCVILCTAVTLTMIFIPKIRESLYPFGSEESANTDTEENESKLKKFTFKHLRKRINSSRGSQHRPKPKYPSVSSVATSQMSLSTTASSLDSRRNTLPLSECSTADPTSHVGSLVSFNAALSSLPTESTILERPNAEEAMSINEEEEEEEVTVADGMETTPSSDNRDNVDGKIIETQTVDNNENVKV